MVTILNFLAHLTMDLSQLVQITSASHAFRPYEQAFSTYSYLMFTLNFWPSLFVSLFFELQGRQGQNGASAHCHLQLFVCLGDGRLDRMHSTGLHNYADVQLLCNRIDKSKEFGFLGFKTSKKRFLICF